MDDFMVQVWKGYILLPSTFYWLKHCHIATQITTETGIYINCVSMEDRKKYIDE